MLLANQDRLGRRSAADSSLSAAWRRRAQYDRTHRDHDTP